MQDQIHTHARKNTPYLEETFKHDVYDFVLLVDVIQFNKILERIQLILPLGLEQPLI